MLTQVAIVKKIIGMDTKSYLAHIFETLKNKSSIIKIKETYQNYKIRSTSPKIETQ